MYAGPGEIPQAYANKMLLAALQEAQSVVRSYDTKAQIVGVGYILALNLVLHFGDVRGDDAGHQTRPARGPRRRHRRRAAGREGRQAREAALLVDDDVRRRRHPEDLAGRISFVSSR